MILNSLVFLRPLLVAKFNYKKHKKMFFKPFSARLASKFVKGANIKKNCFCVVSKPPTNAGGRELRTDLRQICVTTRQSVCWCEIWSRAGDWP